MVYDTLVTEVQQYSWIDNMGILVFDYIGDNMEVQHDNTTEC